jgi:hypothetical protein
MLRLEIHQPKKERSGRRLLTKPTIGRMLGPPDKRVNV